MINELKAINKPFIVMLNCKEPSSAEAKNLSDRLSSEYGVSVMPVNCLELDEEDIKEILKKILYQFPVKEVTITLPAWINSLPLERASMAACAFPSKLVSTFPVAPGTSMDSISAHFAIPFNKSTAEITVPFLPYRVSKEVRAGLVP